jgi:histidinol phosphatase-like PHP family hydrolase
MTSPSAEPLANRSLAELLAVAAEGERDQRQRTLRRAARRALMWPVEAALLAQEGRRLTELDAVGPWVARKIEEWLERPPALPEPPALRAGFRSFAECRAIVDAEPAWRAAVRADLQMHTSETDGALPLAEMVEAAAAYGYAHVAITDHSKGLVITNGMDEARLRRQGEEIGRLNARRAAPPRVLRAIEMNLSPAGAGDMDDDALRELDLVLGAFHSKLRTKEDQTDRYLLALANPTVHVLAHPRGRIWNFRLGLSADWARVAQRAAELDKALEIDAYPDRQDLNVELLAHVKRAGGRVSIGTDAHNAEELRYLDIGVAAVITAGIPRERVLNCMSADELVRWAKR